MFLLSDEASRNNEMHSYFRHASVTLKDIISQPGIWDPFVLGYVNVRHDLTLCNLKIFFI